MRPAGRPLSAAVYPERSPLIAQPPQGIFDILLQNVRIFVLIPNPLFIQVLRERGGEAPQILGACVRGPEVSIRANLQTTQQMGDDATSC